MITTDSICPICEDDGTDWTDDLYAYHRACLEDRAEHPDNDRQRRGVEHTLRFGKPIPSLASGRDIELTPSEYQRFMKLCP